MSNDIGPVETSPQDHSIHDEEHHEDTTTINSADGADHSASSRSPLLSQPSTLSRLSSDEWLPLEQKQRPRLAYLRSAWTSQNRSVQNDKNDYPFSLRLPPWQLQRNCDEEEEVAREVHRLVSVAVGICLACAAAGTVLVFQSSPIDDRAWMQLSMQPLFIVWWGLLTRAWSKRPESIRLFLIWAQNSALTMAAVISAIPQMLNTHTQSHWLIVSLVLTCVCFFYIARRFERANEQQKQRINNRITEEQRTAQTMVDNMINMFADRRLAFMNTVSQEIQDAALMVMTTLEQFSPATILANTHELLSACSIAVPIASITAINTTIKQVCHISSHLQLMARLLREGITAPPQHDLRSNVQTEFDTGELVQTVGDALAGMAAKLDVNLVIYHSDNGLHHTNVLGDEDAVRYGLLNLLRNILEGCSPGACLELGLNIVPSAESQKVGITFEITHSTSRSSPDSDNPALLPNANFTAQLIQYIGGSITVEEMSKNRTKFDVTVDMEIGQDDEDRQLLVIKEPSMVLERHYTSVKFANEPTLKELILFIEKLKGLKMVLHAPQHSVFAKHLTSCLASWNTDISHVPVMLTSDPSEDDISTSGYGTTPTSEANVSIASANTRASNNRDPTAASTPLLAPEPHPAPTSRSVNTPSVPSPAIEEEHLHSLPPAFILIDDDIPTLERKLREFHTQPPASAPFLQSHQHARRHKLNKAGAPYQNFFHHGTTAIIHFTSLANYKRVRDTVQWFSVAPGSRPFSMPRIVVVPKPAGPRRFLTALHTAWHNAVVEPHFLPIATSPSSPMPPSIALMLQQEAGHTPPTPSSAHLGSPGSEAMHGRTTPSEGSQGGAGGGGGGGGVRRRPNSGIYSPPAGLSMENATDGGNYFFDPVARTPGSGNAPGTSVGGVNVAPSFDAATARSSLHRTLVPGRRRSHTELTPQPSNDYLTSMAAAAAAAAAVAAGQAGSHPPYGPVSPGGTPLGPSEASALDNGAASTVNLGGKPGLTPTNDVGDNGGLEGAAVTASSIPETSGPLRNPPSPLAAPSATAAGTNASTGSADATPSESKKPARTMSHFKLNKKKKREKNSAFANVASPPINVLIVEDNMINQAILSTWMKKHKIKFSVASNGQEAVEKWKGGGFHLVLMDIQLPIMNGIEATKLIRAIEKEQKIGVLPMSSSFLREQQSNAAAVAAAVTDNLSTETMLPADLPKSNEELPPSTFRSPVIIVALTASSLESDRHAALAAGCNDFLTKPVSLEWLEKKIIEWGCMQALIDFEGWRRWKRSTDSDQKPSKKEDTVVEEAKQQLENEKKRIEEIGKNALQTRKGIVLPGAVGLSKSRRYSTMEHKSAGGSRKGQLMKSESDTSLHQLRSRTSTKDENNSSPLKEDE
ncbi:uncharacterized protein BYT42DRAFT_614678 [Radiomyces spectabilis]|uniref:uncharacterized protein n=1 Tax=Radiomyces spectabilis TaxID=64574 RepID=UPI00221FC3E8|nr:uncharacterized protein BYT42DRAFT_614678 [Radiomyces spectabilis]KAI8378051.1 hypothetical protein BYT42DRAFT_614678 [Radiomyces spectabilis]